MNSLAVPWSSDAGRRLGVAWAVAVASHAIVLAYALFSDRTLVVETVSRYVPVEVVEVAPKVEAPPVPPPVAPKRQVDKVVDLTARQSTPTPPPTETAAEAPPPKPVFGLGKKSFGSTGSFAVRTGNTVGIRPEDSAIGDAVGAYQPVPVYEVTTLPSIRAQPEPNYPPALRAAGVEGDVVLELLIDADGNVVAADVVETSDPAFDKAALDAGRAVKFSPARQGNTAVAVRIRFPIKFRLR